MNIWIAVSQPYATNVEARCHPIIIWNIVTSTSGRCSQEEMESLQKDAAQLFKTNDVVS